MGSDPFLGDFSGADDPGASVDARLEQLLGATDGPLDWRSIRAAEAPARWEQLRDWVGWFRFEFGFDHRVVPPCWYQHPALVQVLSALRDHWLVAYDPQASPDGAADWHRSLILLEQRLRDWASRTGCTVGMHRSDVIAEYPDDAEQWRAHVAADAAARERREATADQAITDNATARDKP